MSHNVCYDYNKLRWKVQPSDMVAFDDHVSGYYIGEIVSLSRELMHVKRLKDGRIFVISLSDLKHWRVKPVDTVRRLPNGVFQLCERVELVGVLNLPDQVYTISKFDHYRVKVHLAVKGRSVCWYYVRESEVLKYKEVK